MKNDVVQVSIIIPAHNEKELIFRTIRSVIGSAEYSTRNGINAEIIVVEDNVDAVTKEYVKKH